jgi:hypothetical protein
MRDLGREQLADHKLLIIRIFLIIPSCIIKNDGGGYGLLAGRLPGE